MPKLRARAWLANYLNPVQYINIIMTYTLHQAFRSIFHYLADRPPCKCETQPAIV